jgi:hypothetical protein
MIDVDPFITILYVMVDDFCQSQAMTWDRHTGLQAALSCSEVVTLALSGQFVQFPSERAFFRYAQHHLRVAFPTLPHRSQFNRLQRQAAAVIAAFGLVLVERMQAHNGLFERIDSSGIAIPPTRCATSSP